MAEFQKQKIRPMTLKLVMKYAFAQPFKLTPSEDQPTEEEKSVADSTSASTQID
jgi:hypothetical protein